MNAQALAYATASLRSLAKTFDPTQPRDEHGRWTDAGGNTSRGADRPTGYRVDNPGGQWLREQQEEAYNGKSKTARKGLRGTQTAWAGYDKPLMLPVSDLATLGGVNDEVRLPGDPQFDWLLPRVEKDGYTNEDPVMVFVNHHGRAYINEGNTRIAVAKQLGVDRIKTWVAWYNGGEQAAGDWTPEAVARMERGHKAFDPDQPRAPAGQSNGGQWVGAGGSDFDQWFAGSVMVNADGSPRVVYHQTSKEAEEKILKGGYELGRSLALGSDEQMPNGVFFSTTSQDLGLATAEDGKRTIIPTYLAIKNPLRVKNRDELGDFLSKDEEWLRLHDEVNALDRQVAADYDKFDRETFADKTLTREQISQRIHEAGAALDAGGAKIRELAGVARVRSTEIIRAAGYDSVWMQDDQGGLFGRKHITTVVVLDPKAARPVAAVKHIGAKAFDPGQPRDDHGRWTDGQRLTEVGEMFLREGATRDEARKFVKDKATEWGVNPDHVDIVDADQAEIFTLGGQRLRSGGSFNPVTGSVQITYEPFAWEKDDALVGLAHEIEHLKYEHAGALIRSMENKQEGTVARIREMFPLEEIRAAGGITDYSKQYWKSEEFKDDVHVFDWARDRTINETLAEVNATKIAKTMPFAPLGYRASSAKEIPVIWDDLHAFVDAVHRDGSKAIVEWRRPQRKYSEDQPRDDHGRWTSGGSGIGSRSMRTSSLHSDG